MSQRSRPRGRALWSLVNERGADSEAEDADQKRSTDALSVPGTRTASRHIPTTIDTMMAERADINEVVREAIVVRAAAFMAARSESGR